MKTSGPIVFCALYLFFIVGVAALSRQFPPVDTDEIFISVHGYNLLSGQGGRYSLYDDIFAPTVYSFRDAFGQVLETMTNAWVGVWTKLTPRNYWHSRLASWSAGALSLLVFYGIGICMGGVRTGLCLMLLLMTDPIFITASCVVRPETLLLLTGSLTVWLILRLPFDFPWKASLIGMFIGLQIGVHPNALALAAGFIAFYAAADGRSGIGKRLALMMVGWVGGILVIALSTDLYKLWLVSRTFTAQMFTPPLLSSRWPAQAILHSAADKLFMTRTYYFDERLAWGWTACLKVRAVGIGLCLLGLMLSRVPSTRKTGGARGPTVFFIGLAGAFAGMAAWVARQDVLYNINYYPFLIPLAGGFFRLPDTNVFPLRMLKVLKGSATLCLMLSLLFFARFVQSYRHLYTPFPGVTRQFRSLLSDPNLKILAPNVFWYDHPPQNLRDIGALNYSRWYTGGHSDVARWLSGWKPDALIIDGIFKRFFLGPLPTGPALTHLLKRPVKYLGTIETGAGSYGSFEVYQVHWPAQE